MYWRSISTCWNMFPEKIMPFRIEHSLPHQKHIERLSISYCCTWRTHSILMDTGMPLIWQLCIWLLVSIHDSYYISNSWIDVISTGHNWSTSIITSKSFITWFHTLASAVSEQTSESDIWHSKIITQQYLYYDNRTVWLSVPVTSVWLVRTKHGKPKCSKLKSYYHLTELILHT